MKKEHIKIISAVLLSVTGMFVISFGIGFFKGTKKDIVEIPEKVSYIPEPSATPENTEKAPEPEYYLIDAENGEIKLYFVKGETVTELRSENISTEVFPKEDIIMLSEGIKTDTSEEALEVWENFIS